MGLTPGLPVLVVLPGSRTSEVSRLMQPFGETIGLLQRQIGPVELILPAVPSVRPLIEEALAAGRSSRTSSRATRISSRPSSLPHAALAASGTVTLELAVAGTPMAVAYRVDRLAAQLRFL